VIQVTTTAAAPPPAIATAPRLWGLGAAELLDAYWRSRGVQCVRRGERTTLQRAAELYLLVEPDQLALFDVAALSERLTWHAALVTRLRLVDEDAEPYSEHVVLDDRGLVERIERRYMPAGRETYRVILTTRRRVAAIWMAADDARDAWQRMRRSVPWSRVDHGRVVGTVYRKGDGGQERQLIARLVEHWPQPEQSIEGIEESAPGVWHRHGRRLEDEEVRIGPLWIGDGDGAVGQSCLVGPDWVEDASGAACSATQATPIVIRDIAEVTLPTVSRARPGAARGGLYPLVKRAMDVAVSATGLLLAAPLMAIIALLIMLEDGAPVLFGHQRQGRSGRPFSCWKFRTMHRDAEQIVRDLEAYNVCDGPQVFIQDDPRVTRIGRALRATHLDELPQLWNVLVGDMSLVGPRPSPNDENVYCPAWRDTRLSVRPGITGLWQLERTREPGEDFQEWIRYDIEYVRRAGLRLDLTILAKTARILVLGRSDRASE
jgi:lipopolysaccharide/colanic/teichoic acid biosynthesis glycosyltransferase